MDNFAIRATDDFCGAGYPTDAAAILLCELDGVEEEVEDQIAGVRAVLERCGGDGGSRRARRRRVRALLDRAQGRLPRRRAPLPRLPLHGRHHPAARVAGGAQPHAGRLSEESGLRIMNVFHGRRRQPAPSHPLRRERPWRAGARRTGRCADPGALRRGRRDDHRRARGRSGEDRPDVRAVRIARAGAVPGREGRVRSARTAEPRQGGADPATVRRVRRHARARRQAAVSPGSSGSESMDSDWTERLRDRSLAAAADGDPARRHRRRDQGVPGTHHPGGAFRRLRPPRHRLLRADRARALGPRRDASRGGDGRARRKGSDARVRAALVSAQRATIGGTIATGLSGPARPYAGAARDFVLGTRVLNGKGEVLRFGGEVMKNVAGYDVSRLMTGACGTLGVLLDVSLKVLPLPAVSRTLAFDVTAAEAIERCNAWGREGRCRSPGPATTGSGCASGLAGDRGRRRRRGRRARRRDRRGRRLLDGAPGAHAGVLHPDRARRCGGSRYRPAPR